MTLQQSLKVVAVTLLIALFAVGGLSASARVAATNVPAGIQISKDLGLADPSTEINITVHLKLSDKAAFDKAVDALYDPASPTFHKWMTNADLKKYAPTQAQQQIVRQELQSHGLTILSTDPIGFTVRAHGTIGSVESAFNTEIHQFEYSGRAFRANVRNAQLSGKAGSYVSSVAGLESHQVRPLYSRALDPHTQEPYAPVQLGKLTAGSGFPAATTTQCLAAPQTITLEGTTAPPTGVFSGTVYTSDAPPNYLVCDYLPAELQSALGLNDVYAAGLTGKGQTIVLMEGYGYPTLEKDANAFFKMAGLPLLNSSNFSIVYPEGKPANPKEGILAGWNTEMALDLQWSHTIAPGAKILVVAVNGQDSEDFQDAISYVANNQLGNQISNSYEEDVDIIAGALEQTSWDDTLEVATAKGISVNFSTGDSGDEGLGTPVGAPGVPSDAPHATAVGGTSILNDVNNPGYTITTSWGDSWVALTGYQIFLSNPPSAAYVLFDPPLAVGLVGGGGGGGESIFWAKPSWQQSLPGKGRQTPDVSALADPYTGVPIVISFGKYQYLFIGVGGTSLASPIFTGFWALANEKAGWALGQAAPAIAALPYGGVQDVLPTNDLTPNNATGVITDQNGTTDYSASELFNGLLYGNKGFTSAIWYNPSPDSSYVLGFGIDTSLTVKKGWDNATGFGTPYGLAFIDAVTGNTK
jgi:subtilase family serine protease